MIQKITTLLFSMLLFLSCSHHKEKAQSTQIQATNWKNEVEKTVKLFGHRNWIVVADGAYPKQSNPAIKTIAVDADQLEVVNYVNQLIAKANHVDANIFVDKEMDFVAEEDAAGIDKYRTELTNLLETKSVKTKLHESIISELDNSAKLFNVLIIKTNLAIPYTSVFFQLECGYWNGDAEKNMRQQLEEATTNKK